MESLITLKGTIDWQALNEPSTLLDDSVHVWYADANMLIHDYQDLFDLLSKDEKARAARYKIQLDGKRFIARRASLRIILSKYIGESPRAQEIRSDDLGKPKIIQRSGSMNVSFSLSHSQNSYIFAICKNPRIGIDVEYMREIDYDAILNTLSPSKAIKKKAYLRGNKQLLFYRIWTSLEAYVKATGIGMSQSLDGRFWESFPLDIDHWLIKDPYWTILTFSPERAFLATLAVNLPDITTTFFKLSEISEQKY